MYPYMCTYIYNCLFYVRDPAFKFIDRVAINASIADSILWIRLQVDSIHSAPFVIHSENKYASRSSGDRIASTTNRAMPSMVDYDTFAGI